MVRMQIGESRVGMTMESLIWFLVFTGVGTVIGMVAYDYLFPYLPDLPAGIFDPSGVTGGPAAAAATAPVTNVGQLGRRHTLRVR
jgi:hypothetical protein